MVGTKSVFPTSILAILEKIQSTKVILNLKKCFDPHILYTRGQNFQIWGQTISDDFMVPNDTERTTEEISSVETG